MKVEFYYDPSCPWCWVTSRWLTEVSQHRDLEIEWRPFSLAIINNELDGDDVTGHLDTHTIGYDVLLLIEAIHEQEGTDKGELYTEFGKSYYLDKSIDDEKLIPAVLDRLGLSHDLIEKAKDKKYHDILEKHIQDSKEVVGEDVGVPQIVFVNENNEKQGYFGPVLQGLPELEEGLELFDGLSRLARASRFFELKRTRKGRSKAKTTKRLFEEFS